ncbi:unnamed protein product, partial [Closterium sp. Naga37s-1]
ATLLRSRHLTSRLPSIVLNSAIAGAIAPVSCHHEDFRAPLRVGSVVRTPRHNFSCGGERSFCVRCHSSCA